MKRQFGSLLSRLIGRSTSLSDLEHQIVESLVDQLPPELQSIAAQQFEAYDMVQREVDGRALNFYFATGSQRPLDHGVPAFEQRLAEAKLMRAEYSVGEDTAPIHAVLTAVSGRVFCVTFSRQPTREEHTRGVRIVSTVPAWKVSLGGTSEVTNSYTDNRQPA